MGIYKDCVSTEYLRRDFVYEEIDKNAIYLDGCDQSLSFRQDRQTDAMRSRHLIKKRNEAVQSLSSPVTENAFLSSTVKTTTAK